MKTLIRLMLVSLFVFIPNSAQATDEVVKSYCAYLFEYDSLEELKDAILVKAKVLAVNELFGEVIRASTTVENFIVTDDQIQSTSVGFIRIRGDVAYYNGSSLAEVCVRITAYVTQEDRRRFQVYVDSLEPQQQATPTPTRRRSTATPTTTPNRTATAQARTTRAVATRAARVQLTIEAIQEATRVADAVALQLTQAAPAVTPSAIARHSLTQRITPTPVPAPTRTSTPSCLVTGPFHGVWQVRQAQLGCPVTEPQSTSVTIEPFEQGYMVWVKATDRIYTLTRGSAWREYTNPWRAGEDSFSCAEARQIGYPAMGFGRIWCHEMKVLLGLPIDRERPRDVGVWQVFPYGRVLLGYNDLVLVMYSNGSWEEIR